MKKKRPLGRFLRYPLCRNLLLDFDRSGLFDLFKGFEESRDVGFGGVVCDGDGFGFEITDDVLDAFLKGNILHDLVNTTLAMEIHRKNHYLLIRAPFPTFPLKGEGE